MDGERGAVSVAMSIGGSMGWGWELGSNMELRKSLDPSLFRGKESEGIRRPVSRVLSKEPKLP